MVASPNPVQPDLIQLDSNTAIKPVVNLPQDKPKGFLQEDNGNYSTMRLMSFIALITAIIFGGYTIANPIAKEAGVNITFSFLVAAFAPKAVQKFAERPPN